MLTGTVKLILLMTVLCIKGSIQCESHVCFTWKLTVHTLTLICKVDDLHFRLLIDDPSGKSLAECLPPFSTTRCETYYRNMTIKQNLATKETIFTLVGKIDYHLNGNWSCRHGASRDVAQVEVTILRISGISNRTDNCTDETRQCTNTGISDTDCLKNSLLLTMTSFILSLMIGLMMSAHLNCKIIYSCNKKACSYIENTSKARKRTLFLVFTVILFALVACVGFLDGANCLSQYFLMVPVAVFGFACSVICLKGREDHAEEEGLEDPAEDEGERPEEILLQEM